MLSDKQNLGKQIQAVVGRLKLGENAIEKDIYVTKAIHVLSQLEHEYYRLVFKGGTCLSKAHKIIPRMSEDCDFRVEKKLPAINFSRTKTRNELKNFRLVIREKLHEAGFMVESLKITVEDEGHLVNMRMEYPSIYAKEISALNPFLSFDFFLGDVKTPTLELPVTTLIRNTLGETINHPERMVTCVSVTETAAEKLIALTRRIATSTLENRGHFNDPALVRHMYDLYKINEAGKLEDEFSALVTTVLLNEVDKFKSQNVNYADNPYKEIERALKILENEEWRQNWNQFISDMVFELTPPTYEQVLQNLNNLSTKAIGDMQKTTKSFFMSGVADM